MCYLNFFGPSAFFDFKFPVGISATKATEFFFFFFCVVFFSVGRTFFSAESATEKGFLSLRFNLLVFVQQSFAPLRFAPRSELYNTPYALSFSLPAVRGWDWKHKNHMCHFLGPSALFDFQSSSRKKFSPQKPKTTAKLFCAVFPFELLNFFLIKKATEKKFPSASATSSFLALLLASFFSVKSATQKILARAVDSSPPFFTFLGLSIRDTTVSRTFLFFTNWLLGE